MLCIKKDKITNLLNLKFYCHAANEGLSHARLSFFHVLGFLWFHYKKKSVLIKKERKERTQKASCFASDQTKNCKNINNWKFDRVKKHVFLYKG